jgi:DIS3-like exonuclease 2
MLLANMAVAKQLFDSFPNIAMLRCHSPPHDKLMSELSKSLKAVGVDLDVSSSSTIHACLNNYISAEDPDKKAIGYGLSSLLAKPMAVSKLVICDSIAFIKIINNP